MAEASAGSSSGAKALWGDKCTVPAALQLLAVPPSDPQQMHFQDPDFQRALKVHVLPVNADATCMALLIADLYRQPHRWLLVCDLGLYTSGIDGLQSW